MKKKFYCHEGNKWYKWIILLVRAAGEGNCSFPAQYWTETEKRSSGGRTVSDAGTSWDITLWHACVCVCLWPLVCEYSGFQVLSNSLWPCGLTHQAPALCLEFTKGRIWVVMHFLLQGVFPTQRSNLHLLSLALTDEILYHIITWGRTSHNMSPLNSFHSCCCC